MKHLFFLLLLFITSACGEDIEVLTKVGVNSESEPGLAYRTGNGHGWSPSGIGPSSVMGAGECAIVGSDVVYTKIDNNFNGIDYCVELGGTHDHCDDESYEIDFSSSSPELFLQFHHCS